MRNKKNLTAFAQLALLVAIEFVMSVTPLGFINLGVISATLMHIPVIIGSIILGPSYGAALGLEFGLISLYKASSATGVVNMAFSPFVSGKPLQSLILSLVPRILIGILPHYIHLFLQKYNKKDSVTIGISAALTSAFHTITVLGCLVVFFPEFQMTVMTIMVTLISLSGIAEVLLATFTTSAVATALKKAH